MQLGSRSLLCSFSTGLRCWHRVKGDDKRSISMSRMCSCATCRACVRPSAFGPLAPLLTRHSERRPDLPRHRRWIKVKGQQNKLITTLTTHTSQESSHTPPRHLRTHLPRSEHCPNRPLSNLHHLTEPTPSTLISSSTPILFAQQPQEPTPNQNQNQEKGIHTRFDKCWNHRGSR